MQRHHIKRCDEKEARAIKQEQIIEIDTSASTDWEFLSGKKKSKSHLVKKTGFPEDILGPSMFE